MIAHVERTGISRRAVLLGGLGGGVGVLGAASRSFGQDGKKVKLAGTNILSSAPIYVARQLAYFAGEGLDAEILESPSGNVSISALLGGSVDAAVIGTVNNWLLAEQGMKAKSIVGIAMRSTNVLVVRSDLDVQADDPASLVKALKGKRFGVASLGSGGDMVASGVLEEFGSKSGDFVKVAVGVGGTALAALKSGAVDGLVTYEPDLTQIVRSGAGKIALDLRSTQAERLFSRLPTTTLMARSEWIDKNQDVAQKLIKAVVRANTTLRDDPDTSVKVLGKLYPSIQLGDIKAIYNGERGGFRSTLEKEEFELAQNTYLKAKAISKSYPFEELNDVRFAPLWT